MKLGIVVVQQVSVELLPGAHSPMGRMWPEDTDPGSCDINRSLTAVLVPAPENLGNELRPLDAVDKSRGWVVRWSGFSGQSPSLNS